MNNIKVGDKIIMVSIDPRYTYYDSIVYLKQGIILKIKIENNIWWCDVNFGMSDASPHLLKYNQVIKIGEITTLERVIYGIPDEALP